MIQAEMRNMEEYQRKLRAVKLTSQGSGATWVDQPQEEGDLVSWSRRVAVFFPRFHWVPPLGGALIHTPVMLICLWSGIISQQYLRPAHSTFLHQFVSWSTLVLGLLCILWFLLFMLTYPVLLVFLVTSWIHHTHNHRITFPYLPALLPLDSPLLDHSGWILDSLSSVWTLTRPVLLFPRHPPLASKRPLFKFHAAHDSWPSFEFHAPPTIPVCTVFTCV